MTDQFKPVTVKEAESIAHNEIVERIAGEVGARTDHPSVIVLADWVESLLAEAEQRARFEQMVIVDLRECYKCHKQYPEQGVSSGMTCPSCRVSGAEQRASAGMQAAAALMAHNLSTVCQSMGQQAEHDGSLDESRGLFDATENISKLAQNIESLTQADGTNALRQVEANARLDELKRSHFSNLYPNIGLHADCPDCERIAELKKEIDEKP